MAKTCNNCKTKSETVIENQNMLPVPFAAHESAMARYERHNKRQWIIILVLIGALIGTNLAWIVYNSQFEVVEESTIVEQENDSGDNNYIGNDGDINYGEAENNN